MERKVKLYYFPGSYYSQKACIALEEMGVAYESVLIDIHGSKPQKEAWYLRLNPNGTVPTLQDGDVIVTESEDIVTHVGKGSQLVPDVNTKYGQEVAKWRKTINAVSIETITMGTVFNPELSCSGFKAPKSVLNREKVKASFQAQLDECKQLMEKNPDLRKEYEAKINKLQWRLQTYGDKSKITPALDNLESLFDQLEQQLTKMAAGQSPNQWLCGPHFTAADINLCITLGRLDLLGLAERYHSDTKRPRVHEYWRRAQMRPSINRVTVHAIRNTMRAMFGQSVRKTLPVLGGLLAVGLAAGLAVYFAQKRYVQ